MRTSPRLTHRFDLTGSPRTKAPTKGPGAAPRPMSDVAPLGLCISAAALPTEIVYRVHLQQLVAAHEVIHLLALLDQV